MAATDLTTVSDFKAAQNISTTTDDAWIAQLITRASAWIEQVTNRKLVARRYNGATAVAPNNFHTTTNVYDEDYLYFDGDPYNQRDRFGNGLVYLPHYPIQSNTYTTFQLSILSSRDNTGDTWDSTTLQEGRDYIVDRINGSIRLQGSIFGLGIKNYRVQMAAGYMLPTAAPQAPWVPYDLQQLCIELTNQIYRDRKNLKSESIGTWAREWDTSKEDRYISDILGAYSRYILPSY